MKMWLRFWSTIVSLTLILILFISISEIESQKQIEDQSYYAVDEHWTQWSACTSKCGTGLQRRQKAKRCLFSFCLGYENQERKCNTLCDEITIQLADDGAILYSNLKEELTAQEAIAWCKSKGYKHVKALPTGQVTEYVTKQAFKGNIKSDAGGFWTGKLQTILDPVTGGYMDQCQTLVIGRGMHGQWFSDIRAKDCATGTAHPVCELPDVKLQQQLDMINYHQQVNINNAMNDAQIMSSARQNYNLQVENIKEENQQQQGEQSWQALYAQVAAARAAEANG